ncbi:MAG: site-specific integrase [Halopseudomonas aestusnigri]
MALKIKILERAVSDLEPANDKEYLAWDTDLKGFGIRVKPNGTKTFLIQYRNMRRLTKRVSLGQFGTVTAAEARKEAKKKLAEVALGSDPKTERDEIKAGMSISDLCEAYMAAAESGQVMTRGKPKKASTVAIDHGRVQRHIIPLLGKVALQDLSRSDVQKFMQGVISGKTAADIKTGTRGRARVTGGPGTAAKCVSLLSSMMTYAINHEWIENNPCQGIQKPRDNRRDRYLKAEEYKALGAQLNQVEELELNFVALKAIRALILSGCRKGEILNLRWSEVDFESQCLRFDDTKTGRQIRPVASVFLNILLDLPWRNDSEWVFPSLTNKGPLSDVRKVLLKVCKAAELEGVSAHVFRHSFATVAHELGFSELTIGGLIGHASHSITSRYAHHVDSALLQAANRVGTEISKRLTSIETSKVVPIRVKGQ